MLLALGMTLVIATGGVDLSVGSLMAVSGAVAATQVNAGAPVAQAVADYQTWQRAIGRDINPSKLVALVMAAGAKRVTVTAPTYTAVAATKVSALQGEAVISYGGLEDD